MQIKRSELSFHDKTSLALDNNANKHRLLHANQFAGPLHLWNLPINRLFEDRNFLHQLRFLYHPTQSILDFLANALLLVTKLDSSHLVLQPPDLLSHFMMLQPQDFNLALLPGQSNLELALLIAAAQLDIILNTDTVNLSMAYNEYRTLATRAKTQASASGSAAVGMVTKVWGKDIAIGAWKKLVEHGLSKPVLGTVRGA